MAGAQNGEDRPGKVTPLGLSYRGGDRQRGSGAANGLESGTPSESEGGEGYTSRDVPRNAKDQLAELRSRLAHAEAIQRGAENLAYQVGAGQGLVKAQSADGLQATVEAELDKATTKVRNLTKEIEQLENLTSPPRKGKRRVGASPSPNLAPRADGPSDSGTSSARDLFRETLASIPDLNATPEKVDALRHGVALLQQHSRLRYEFDMELALATVMPCLSDASTTDLRCTSYRLLRYLLIDIRDVTQLCDASIELFIIKTLARDHHFETEKQHALALFRSITAVPEGTKHLSAGTVRAVVSLAETHDEKLRMMAIETLAELLVRDVALLQAAEGIKVVMNTLLDGPSDLIPSLAALIMVVVDRPSGRHHLRKGIDFEAALAGITEAGSSGSSFLHEGRLRASAQIMAVLLRSWTGLFYLCLNEKRSIRMYVETLKVPAEHTQTILLDTLFEIFQIRDSVFFGPFLAGKRLTHLQANGAHPNAPADPYSADKPADRVTLVQHFLALVLLVFFDAGLLEALVEIAETSHSHHVARKASLLIAELLDVSRPLLPVQAGARIQSLPRLFELASTFESGHDRRIATTALRAVDSLQRNKERLGVKPAVDVRTRASPVGEDSLRSGQRQLESNRMQMGFQIDDLGFRNLVVETQVLVTKDHSKWNIEKLAELVEGPLLNPKRLEEVTKSTKVMRRLLSFLHPFMGRYPHIRKTKHSSRFTKLACSTLQSLLSDPGGVRFLMEDKLVDQIGSCLRQLDPRSKAKPADVIMTKDRVEDTLTYGYFEMLGVLSRHPEGLKLMEKAKIFTSFYTVCELKGRDDLVKAIIEHVDYEKPGHARIVLAKALTSSFKAVRLFATNHLANLIQDADGPRTWMIRLLLVQLYDSSPEVCGQAVEILEAACESPEVLETVVQLRPALENLGDVGAPLMLKFLSTPVGARYLCQTDWTSREMDEWFHEHNHSYVVQVETYLAKALEPGAVRDQEDEDMLATEDGVAPPHFYGELVKTLEGQSLLTSKAHFAEFADFIRRHGLEAQDADVLAKLKSILWAVGNIGASLGGITFLEDEGLVQDIVAIAEESQVFSVRGTCYFVLGLIASTPQGPELLADCGWEAGVTPLGNSTGVCVPQDVNSFVQTPSWKAIPRPVSTLSTLAPMSDPVQRQACTSLANLSNHLVANNASRTLARLRAKHRELFKDPALFYRALEMLGGYRYRLATRRYVLDLFSDLTLDVTSAAAVRTAAAQAKASRQPPPRPEFIDLGGLRSGRRSTTSVPERKRIPSGSGILEAYDKQDYLSDSDGDDVDHDVGVEGAKRAPRQAPKPERLEPLLIIRGFLQ